MGLILLGSNGFLCCLFLKSSLAANYECLLILFSGKDNSGSGYLFTGQLLGLLYCGSWSLKLQDLRYSPLLTFWNFFTTDKMKLWFKPRANKFTLTGMLRQVANIAKYKTSLPNSASIGCLVLVCCLGLAAASSARGCKLKKCSSS